ncbi:MAG: hypothetical protein IJN88_08535 [Clostridia bacterium]|nr:hypothetical protein [Clostridia bacterium]
MDFSSLNMENIENILSSMSNEDMEMLSEMAQSFFSSAEQKENKKESSHSPPSDDNSPFSSFNIDFETLSKIMNIMEKLRNRPEDPRCRLLMSLKPMLSEKRQSKVDEALKIMSLLSFLPLINELRGDSDG